MNVVHSLRKICDLTQVELALIVGMHPMTISKIERGQLELSPWWLTIFGIMNFNVRRMVGMRWSEHLAKQGPVSAFCLMLHGKVS